jgi:homogentisate 1,2-dioxygenase
MNKQYMSGFGNHFQTEALADALPRDQNSPQACAHNLYAEQISGSAFTAARHQNRRSWVYRIHPSVAHTGEFTPYQQPCFNSAPIHKPKTPPTQMRWNALEKPIKTTNFIDSIRTMAANGQAGVSGGAIHLYAINESMTDTYFYNTDGDLLFVPQEGTLILKTEMGIIEVAPTEIAVIQRGIRFQVQLHDNFARGYICETYGAPFTLPERGPIGANGLADERHFLTPIAHYEERSGDFTLVTKFNGELWETKTHHSPLDVVAWFGNYAPYKYNLKHFNTINSVSFDHADPSIFTVLTSPTLTPGVANIDFVIFPERWSVSEHTFRPPYYHRNVMSEYMGLIHGVYDAKADGFVPGGGSLHNPMIGHGVDKATFDKASKEPMTPNRYNDTLAFMFESSMIWHVTDFALNSDLRQKNYLDCWKNL